MQPVRSSSPLGVTSELAQTMLFNSAEFVAFFVCFYLLYVLLRRGGQNVLLLAGSYFFYGCWDWRFLSLILASTALDHFSGLGIERATSTRSRKWILAASVVGNLGILGFFKYFNFFAGSLGELVAMFGLTVDARLTGIVLPVGISFYTFQTMSYTIDIYRGELKPTRNILDFAVFVAYFPQLVAGPIERARCLLPQIQTKRTITYEMVRQGMWLILLGYFKKVVLADNMAVFTQPLFENPGQIEGLGVIIGVYAFALQIYGDFSGYSDIARGISKLMGIDLMVNFRMPYFAVNPSDFWRRWHISLSTWLRDYLYIPLGGNRHGTWMTYRNLMLTMLLGGLWHGAAWNFVAWGLYHGLLLVGHRALSPWLDRIRPKSARGRRLYHLACVVVFLQLTCFGWLLFAVKRLADVPVLIEAAAGRFELSGKLALVAMLLFAGPIALLHLFSERSNNLMVVKSWPAPVRLACYAGLFALIALCGVSERNEFIYFQF